MPTEPRYVPHNALIEISAKTFQDRFLLRPSRKLNRIIVGALAYGQLRHPEIEIHAVTVLSNHYHMLLTPGDAGNLAAFMNLVQSKIAREVQILHGWSGSVWRRKSYTSVPVSDEPEAQVARLRYLLANGTKEGLVSSPGSWPGIHSVDALCRGRVLRGVWYDRRALCFARRSKPDLTEDDFALPMKLRLEPLPCWKKAGISPAEQRRQVRALVRDIERQARADRQQQGTRVAGLSALLTVHPHQRPLKGERTPAPRLHAVRKEVRQALTEAYRRFLEAYGAARDRMRAGVAEPSFPPGSFPPGMPFVPYEAAAPG